MVSERSSALYVGTLRHRRSRPRPHAFTYGVHHALIDLDELSRLDREVIGFGHNRPAVASLWDRDHLGPEELPLRTKLARWLEGQDVVLPAGPVHLLTTPRVLGHGFNPVSWFLCHDREGELAMVVAEVRNTFGESYAYLLDDLERVGGGAVRARRPKVFHVSPFMDIPGHSYRFTIRPPGERLTIHMDVLDADGKLFDATLAERRRAFTSRTLWTLLLRHPLLPLVTVLRIHRHALSLWRKRVPFFRKPEPPANGLDAVARPPSRSCPGSEPAANATRPQERAS